MSIEFVGLDVHMRSIEIAVADPERGSEVRRFGRCGGELRDFEKALRQLEERYPSLLFAYEAGPTGYVLHRYLKERGHECLVVAPTRIPKLPGDRVKTDRRDARQLARLLRAGDLQSVYVPTDEDEAMRDLCRARDDARKSLGQAQRRLKSFLLRHGQTYPANRKSWTEPHTRWLKSLRFDEKPRRISFEEYRIAVDERTWQFRRLDGHIAELAPKWRMWSYIRALQAMRGVRLTVASTVGAELGDLTRFDKPTQLMSYVGLVPSENSSGGRRSQGGITKAGNGPARRMLIEAATSYRYRAAVTVAIRKRQQGVPQSVIEIAWRAQLRLCKLSQRLRARGKHANKVKTAVAREMLGFMWAIAQEVPIAE